MESQRISIFSNTKSDRDFRATTGLSKEEFNRLSDKFSCYYTPTVLSGFPNGFGNNSIFQNPKEALFFLLYHYKVATTYDVLAISFGIGRATAHNTITSLNPILKKVLEDEKVLPKRIFSNAKDFESYFLNVPDILIDATESPTQRPDNEDEQKDRYSKKNISTV